MTDSQQLLAEFAATGSEPAFRELVVRYVDLVYSTALRLVDGDAHRAKDVSQVVFADLARLAARLAPGSLLGGWLHRHTCYVARTMMRGERRRDARERQAAEMNALNQQPDHAFQEIAPVLDELINELPADDRDAILLRFFERRNLRSVGDALGINENVAQKRVARAVEELSTLLRRRGFKVPAAVLAGGLAANATQAAPLGLAVHLSKAVLGHSAHAGTTATAAKAASATKLKIVLAAALVLAGVIIPLRFCFQPPAASSRVDSLASSTSNEPARAPAPEMFPVSPPSQNVNASEPSPKDSASGSEAMSSIPVASAEISRDAATAASRLPGIPGAIAGVPMVRFYAKPGSLMRISGTANMIRTNWLMESQVIGGTLDIQSDFLSGAECHRRPCPIAAKATAFVAVRSLKSVDDEGKPYSDSMDDLMYSLLLKKRDSAPRIVFHLTELWLNEPGKRRTNADFLTARGKLAIAGVTNEVTVPLQFLRRGTNTVEIYGSNQLMMSSFEIHPQPSKFRVYPFEMKVGDLVTVQFKWRLQQRGVGSATNQDDLAFPNGESTSGATTAPGPKVPSAMGFPSNSR